MEGRPENIECVLEAWAGAAVMPTVPVRAATIDSRRPTVALSSSYSERKTYRSS